MSRRPRVLSSFWDKRRKYSPKLVIPVNLTTNKKVESFFPFNGEGCISRLIELINDNVEINGGEAEIEVRLIIYDRNIPSPTEVLDGISKTKVQKMIENYLSDSDKSDYDPELGMVKSHQYIVEIWDREVREKGAKYCPYGINPCDSGPNDEICNGCLHYQPDKGTSSFDGKYVTTDWCALFPDDDEE